MEHKLKIKTSYHETEPNQKMYNETISFLGLSPQKMDIKRQSKKGLQEHNQGIL